MDRDCSYDFIVTHIIPYKLCLFSQKCCDLPSIHLLGASARMFFQGWISSALFSIGMLIVGVMISVHFLAPWLQIVASRIRVQRDPSLPACLRQVSGLWLATLWADGHRWRVSLKLPLLSSTLGAWSGRSPGAANSRIFRGKCYRNLVACFV